MVSGQVFPSDTSLTKTTTGTLQLSASSVTTNGSEAGTSAIHSTVTEAGLDAVGFVVSSTIIVCVTLVTLPQSSVTEYVLVIVSGQVFPSDTSLTKATTGFIVQLSASSVTTNGSLAGTSAMH